MNTTPLIWLGNVRVRDAMHRGLITCDAGASLQAVARLMADKRVHAVVVEADKRNGQPWGIVSALDVAAAAALGVERTAGEAAATEVVTISADERLDHAARVMTEHELTHLVVIDGASGYPTGILSTLDIAAAYGG